MKTKTFQLHISATPFARISDARVFACGTRKPISDPTGVGLGRVTLKNSNWITYANAIAAPATPVEYNEAAIGRLVKDLDPYIVRVTGVRTQFDAKNSIKMIGFQTDEERAYYNDAWERYVREKAKLEQAGVDKSGVASGRFAILVQLLKFRMAAEFCRRYHLAQEMYTAVKNGKAACAALSFKGTIIAVGRILIEEYGVSRDEISLIWGGGQTQLTKKQKLKQKLMTSREELEAAGINVDELLQQMALEDVEERVLEDLPKHLRMESQSKEERQIEIDRFQSGKSLYCMYTFRAGGVGLSLHHSDEMTKYKVRRKPNGYAVVEDIPNVPVRPRVNFLAPTYSAMEMVQGLGRCPRLTSLSDTEQQLLFYRGTVEEDVARIVSQKLRCLSKVVRQRESWQDIVMGTRSADDHIEKGPIVEETSTNYNDLTQEENEEDDND